MKTWQLAAAALAVSAATAQAADIAPGDFVAAPAGTNLFGLYLKSMTSDRLNNTIAGDIPDSKITTGVTLLRFGHYTELNGKPWVFQAIIPLGGFPTARVGGADLPKAEGLGDITVAATYFPINTAATDPYGTSIGISLYMGMPTGNYDPQRVSFGSGTWTFTPQIGIAQGLGNKWYFDGALDAAIPLDHDEQGVEYSSDPSYQVQAYIRKNLTDKTTVSFGYSGYFGGKSYLDGDYTGAKTRSDQLRVFGNSWVSDTVQVQGMLGTDLRNDGGFKQKLNAEIRIVKLF